MVCFEPRTSNEQARSEWQDICEPRRKDEIGNGQRGYRGKSVGRERILWLPKQTHRRMEIGGFCGERYDLSDRATQICGVERTSVEFDLRADGRELAIGKMELHRTV
jgi:hypothetical protein